MCGIFGLYNTENKDVTAAMKLLRARGRDGSGWFDTEVRASEHFEKVIFGTSGLGHILHAIVGEELQPIQQKGVIVANCEIYNWQELAMKHDIEAKNDADLLCQLLDGCSLEEKEVNKLLEELDGVYAFAYERDHNVLIARDTIGVKPLWFTHQDGFAFASEKKVLLAAGFHDVADLNPRKVLCYNKKNNLITSWKRNFFHVAIQEQEEASFVNEAKQLVVTAIKKRIPSKDIKVGVLLSGGLDSTLIAKVCQDLGVETICYTAAVNNPEGKEPHDLTAAKKVAQTYSFTHKIISVEEQDIPSIAKIVATEIEEANAIKVSVGMPFYVATKQAKKDGCKVLFSGLGAEELFAGYQRHKESVDVNNECISGLSWMYERDLYRDDVITMRQGLELRLPLLDKQLTTFALTVPAEFKLRNGHEKYLLRRVGIALGLKEEDAMRPKKAAQYGSKFDHALQKVARKKGMNRVEYLRSLLPVNNKKLGILCSGGKDSWYAAYVMKKLNYELTVCLTMKSDNQDSYMFHTPAIDLVKLQCESANIPLLEQTTTGEKEKELDDLKLLLKKAKEDYGVEGIVTGALFSQYQRSRIEKLCEELSLKPFAPLWHLEQASELQELLREEFVITMSSIAGDGLSEEWLGKKIGKKEVNELLLLRDKIGFNVAGEGGEYESLVLDCPLFNKKLNISFEKEMENSITGRILIKKAWLETK